MDLGAINIAMFARATFTPTSITTSSPSTNSSCHSPFCGSMSGQVCWQRLKQGPFVRKLVRRGRQFARSSSCNKKRQGEPMLVSPAPSSRCQPPLAGPAAGIELRGCYELRVLASNLRRILPRGDPYRVVEFVEFDQLWHSEVSAVSRVELDPRFLYALPLLFHPVHQPLHGEKQAVAEIC